MGEETQGQKSVREIMGNIIFWALSPIIFPICLVVGIYLYLAWGDE